jgi:hypothetical protein
MDAVAPLEGAYEHLEKTAANVSLELTSPSGCNMTRSRRRTRC